MPLKSDLQLDASKFGEKKISEQTKKFNDGLIKVMNSGPKWYEVGAEKYRQMRWNGETPMPKPTVLETGKNSTLPSREAGRDISIRIFTPENGPSKGIFYHIHGGGWVLQSEAYQDLQLAYYANNASLTVISVGYRLAPEHPFPQGNEDCFDVGEYLVDHGERDFGVPLLFMGGDSAGGHLSVVTTYHLLKTRPAFAFKGLVLNYGSYDLSGFLPQAWHFELPLVLTVDIMQKYVAAYCPNTTQEQRRDPWISPLFMDLNKLKLPPALFTCGTLDPLLDDSVTMSAKWQISGAEAILKIYPGAPHGFSFFPIGGTETTEEGLKDICTFMNERIS
ncbi:hypothetical protein M409DRAFT_26193 [Zasmidium cellare ATCC 36951]|uniref:Alpha/beta hydrolase fold-3 domain-containing protein n=1 Tax=Zasmidium cellare ATCC 36951 TaxID=1080233 RepID=A0A6A6C8W1_ZASCE|nr:uncharacterized protein M409DRAFT_26193 [Zasmidium cellare ATCC 36951]KAF2163584.1 hypothetical protein M409DRAFT_26193 [Zasmidium cellare ATCC 36951]